MILTFFKGLLRELWLLVKDPRGIFMFLVAPLLMNIVVCGAFQNGIVTTFLWQRWKCPPPQKQES